MIRHRPEGTVVKSTSEKKQPGKHVAPKPPVTVRAKNAIDKVVRATQNPPKYQALNGRHPGYKGEPPRERRGLQEFKDSQKPRSPWPKL